MVKYDTNRLLLSIEKQNISLEIHTGELGIEPVAIDKAAFDQLTVREDKVSFVGPGSTTYSLRLI